MSIRTKLLLLLGLAMLVPASMTAILDARLISSLSNDLSARHAGAISEQTLLSMNRAATEYAETLDRESRRIRALVRLQAREAVNVLTAPAPAADTQPVFGTDAFENADAGLELVSAPLPSPARRPGGRAAPQVSWSQAVVHFAPGTDREAVNDDAARLASLAPFFEHMRDPYDALLGWHYVVLDNGLSASYPGHGNTPAAFDPRARVWYVEQKRAPGFRWFRPHFDASTGALLINAVSPLIDAHERFLGVTAIDVDLGAAFERLRLPDHLREGSEIRQVAVVEPPLVERERIVTLARRDMRGLAGDWRTLPSLDELDLGDAESTAMVRDAILAGEDGQLRAAVDGEDSFVLFRRFGEFKTFVVITVPVAVATRPALEAARYAAQTTGAHRNTRLVGGVILAALAAVAAVLVARHFIRPVESLERAVEQLAAGDLEARARVETRDELRTLAEAFNAMVPRLRAHAKVEESLALAREVQQQLLPAAPPRLVGYSIAGHALYSDTTGGDYFDFVALDTPRGKRDAFVIADVSGHGIGPALLMATTRALLHGGRGRGFDPARLLDYVNAELSDDVHRGHFVTMAVLALNRATHDLEWVSAGHDPALLYRAASGEAEMLTAEDIPLGVSADWTYGLHAGRRLEPGDIVVMATDGVWETVDPHGEHFGKARLLELVKSHAALDAAALCRTIESALEDFRGGAAQHDDVTLVILKRDPCP